MALNRLVYNDIPQVPTRGLKPRPGPHPYKATFRHQYWFIDGRRMRDLYETSGFQVYSFFQIFHGLDMRDYGYDAARTSEHFSEYGSDFIGKALADFISANFTPLQR